MAERDHLNGKQTDHPLRIAFPEYGTNFHNDFLRLKNRRTCQLTALRHCSFTACDSQMKVLMTTTLS